MLYSEKYSLNVRVRYTENNYIHIRFQRTLNVDQPLPRDSWKHELYPNKRLLKNLSKPFMN